MTLPMWALIAYNGAMTKTRKHLILSLAFFLGSLAVWSRVVPTLNETPLPPTHRVAVETTIRTTETPESLAFVEGVWEQYAVECNGERSFMARLHIEKEGADYVAYPSELSANTYPKHAYRSHSHSIDGQLWSFKEDWDHGEVGEFLLVRQENGEYVGYATSVDTGYEFETVFVKVSN